LCLMRVCASHNPDLPCIQGVHPHPTPRMRPVFPVRRKRTRSSYAVQMGQTHAKGPSLFARNEQPWRGPADAEAREAREAGRRVRGMRDTGRRGRERGGCRGAHGHGTRGPRGRGAHGRGTAGRGGAGARGARTRGAGSRGCGGPGKKQTHRWPSGGQCRPVRPTVRSGRAGSWPTRHRGRELLVSGH
jgi:hypothetical protein